MRALLLLLAASTSLSGCATYMVQMKLSDDANGADYVIMKTNGDREKVFDCLSRPNGTDWDPTCVKVKFKTNVGDADK